MASKMKEGDLMVGIHFKMPGGATITSGNENTPAPLVGESINIKGSDYVVKRRSWILAKDPLSELNVLCHLMTMSPLESFLDFLEISGLPHESVLPYGEEAELGTVLFCFVKNSLKDAGISWSGYSDFYHSFCFDIETGQLISTGSAE